MRLTPLGTLVVTILSIVALYAFLGAAYIIGQNNVEHRKDFGPHLIPPVSITCQEDMPCWDCTTMGNQKCGKP